MLAKPILESPLEEDLKHLFERPSVVIFISGRRGSGKTDIALLITELLAKLGIIREFASNIKILDASSIKNLSLPICHITNLEDLDSWLKESRSRKLYILDEAGKAIRRRSPMSHMNLGILDDLQVIRHYRCSLIIIAPGEQYIDRAALGSDILDIWIHKWSFRNPKVAVWHDLMEDDVFELSNIPATSIHYDSFDVAPFTRSSPNKAPRFSSEDKNILWKWAQYTPISDLGVDKMKMSRLTHKFIKEVLEKEVTSNI